VTDARALSAGAAPWAGRILHVDLTSGRVETLSTLEYARHYLGGRGLAARLALDLIPPGMGPYDAESPLFFMTGALVGTPAPSAGRVTICGLSPQAYPHEWYTRSNLGGHWGAELKYAGYDGLIVTGRAPHPVTLHIDNDGATLCEAGDLWGMGLIATQARLREALGPETRVLAIGPAGEHLCRYAVIATGTESAAGQGGFGAVMGSKRLKAIAVRGRGGVAVAHPREMLRRARLISEAALARYGRGMPDENPSSDAYGQRPAPCTYLCPRACGHFYQRVPGVVHPEQTYAGQVFCCAPRLAGGEWLGARFAPEAAFELAQMSNDLGLNHWELTFGLGPWLLACQARGELRALDGQALNLQEPTFWAEMMDRIAHRRGWGDLLAEGGPRVADILGVGQDLIGDYYPAYGQSSHWDGHGSFPSPHFPYWLVTSLQWALDTRDPIGGGHGYTTNIFGLVRAVSPEDAAAQAQLRRVGERLYGSAAAVDPRGGYEGKAEPAVRHQNRGALKDSLGVCDNIFPMLTDPTREDYLVAVDGVEGWRLEHHLFEAACDWDLSAEDLDRAGERIFTAERLLAIRNWGRDRATDETIIPYLQRPEGSVNPYLGERVTLDVEAYRALLDACYALRGWDPATARPTEATLRALGLEGWGEGTAVAGTAPSRRGDRPVAPTTLP